MSDDSKKDDSKKIEAEKRKIKRDGTRWDKFRGEPDFDELARHIVDVVAAAGLERSSMGKDWGLTVHVDKDMICRLNHADYALFDVRDPGKKSGDRKVVLAILPEAGEFKAGLWSWIRNRLLGVKYFASVGFPELVPGSIVLRFYSRDLDFILSMPAVRRGIRRHVEGRPNRKLFSKDRHNPMTESLFD